MSLFAPSPDPMDDWVQTFNPGDMVKLKSGSPVMTVKMEPWPRFCVETGREIGVYCSWYDGMMCEAVFHPKQLIREPSGGG